MLPRFAVPTRPPPAFTYSDVAVYALWRHEGATGASAAVEGVRGCGFKFEKVVFLHEGGAELSGY